jgi:hypothetical protein
MYIDYIRAQSELNKLAMQLSGKDELKRFSKSDEHWAIKKTKRLSNSTVKKGDVCQFEFGKNYDPEMSYEHRGLIIGVNKKLLYVLPIFSYDRTAHTDVYHPADNPNEKSDLYLLKNTEFDFIKHDSVLKLNDIRSISINRKLYAHKGRMDINGDMYKMIENLVIQKYFYSFFYEHRKLTESYEKLQIELDNAKSLNEQHEQQINDLRNGITK